MELKDVNKAIKKSNKKIRNIDEKLTQLKLKKKRFFVF